MVIMTEHHFTLNRRGLLGTALATSAALTFGGSPYAMAAPIRRPRLTVPRTLAATGRTRSVQAPGFPIHHLGLSWTGPDTAGKLRLKYADGWRDWQSIAATDSADTDRHRTLLYVGDAAAYEFAPAAGTHHLRLHAINTVDGPVSEAMPDRMRGWHGLTYLSRGGWGADESLRFEPDGTEKFPTAFFDVQTLTVHHTVTANSDPDPAATVRAIYFFQCITEDFGDIGYHLLIDQAGTVYEGRYSGPDPVPVFGPRRVGPRPSMVNGAHVGGFNAGNVGVALLGRSDQHRPTPAARQALVRVLAALASVTRLNPVGTTNYVNPISGATQHGADHRRPSRLGGDRVPGQHLLSGAAATAARCRGRPDPELNPQDALAWSTLARRVSASSRLAPCSTSQASTCSRSWWVIMATTSPARAWPTRETRHASSVRAPATGQPRRAPPPP